jgi:hypothetical protein
MADRISRTPPIVDAIRYRLLRDPLGPVHLAETLSNGGNGSHGELRQTAENAYRVYALAEMLLSVGHVGKQVRHACGRDGKWIRPLFCETRQRIRSVAQQILEQSGPLPDSLNRYLDAVLSENARLLGLKEEE